MGELLLPAALVVVEEVESPIVALFGSMVPHLALMLSVQFFCPCWLFTLAWMHSEKASRQVNWEKRSLSVYARGPPAAAPGHYSGAKAVCG